MAADAGGRGVGSGVTGTAGATGTGWSRRRLLAVGGSLAATGGALLSACGAPAQQGGEAGNPSAQPVTVRFHSRGGAPGSQEVTLYDEQMPLFMQKYPNIKVVHEGFTGEDYPQKITVLAAGNSLGDVMWTAIGGGVIYYFAATKTIQSVDGLVAKEKFDLGQYYKNVIEGLKRDGKLFGLPFKSHPGVSILFYNQTAYEKAGAVPDKTWNLDRLVDAAKRATQGDVFGYNPAVSHKTILTYTRAFGGELLDAEGKKSQLNSPQAQAALTWMYEAFNKHNIAPKPSVAADQGGVDKMFTNGKLAAGKWGTSFQLTAQRDVKDAFKWFASLHPKGPGNVPGSDFEADAYSLTTVTKAPDAAWQWTKWLTNQESGIRLGEIGGTVGGRPDVYKSERLLKDPIRKVFLEAMDTAQPGRPVYNTRLAEYEKTMEAALVPVWEGQQAPTKAFVDELTRQIQVVLDQPLP
jgi:ABC-type glycerol-3-phosphate transport system substrate-binding protein